MVYTCLFTTFWKKKQNRVSNYIPYISSLKLSELNFPMRVKDIPKFEKPNNLNMNVIELTNDTLSPIHTNKIYFQSQIDLLLYENRFCLLTKLHCLIDKDSHMKHVCRRCLTAFSSDYIINDHLKRCINQK